MSHSECNSKLKLLKCSVTSTETVGLLWTGTQDGHLCNCHCDYFHSQLPSSDNSAQVTVAFYCAFRFDYPRTWCTYYSTASLSGFVVSLLLAVVMWNRAAHSQTGTTENDPQQALPHSVTLTTWWWSITFPDTMPWPKIVFVQAVPLALGPAVLAWTRLFRDWRLVMSRRGHCNGIVLFHT